MESILDILFAPVHWIWGAISTSLDASSLDAFIALSVSTLLALMIAYTMCAFAIHWVLTRIAWRWSERLQVRAERGTVDDMLGLAVLARRSESRLHSLASRTGVRYVYADSSGAHDPELAGADELPRRRTLECLTSTVIFVGQLSVIFFHLLRAAVSSVFGLYVLLGTAWTLRPHWFTASVDTFRNWTRTWDPARVPATIALVATVLGLIAAYAFSTKRRARHKSMFDAAVAAENTLATLGQRASVAAAQVAKLAEIVARHDRIFYENVVAELSDGRLRMQDGQATMVNHKRTDGSFQSSVRSKWPARRPAANMDEWKRLCEQRETTLATLTSLRKALSQVESLSPFARQAGTHSWALLRKICPQSSHPDPWQAVTVYNEERYQQHREDLRQRVDRALADAKSPTTEGGNAAVQIQPSKLEQIQTTVAQLQENSRHRLWYLAELYANLALCNEEVHRSRHLRGINAFVARFIKT